MFGCPNASSLLCCFGLPKCNRINVFSMWEPFKAGLKQVNPLKIPAFCESEVVKPISVYGQQETAGSYFSAGWRKLPMGYRPFHRGFRFSIQAAIPSWASSVRISSSR